MRETDRKKIEKRKENNEDVSEDTPEKLVKNKIRRLAVNLRKIRFTKMTCG